MSKRILSFVALIVVFILGILVASWFYQSKQAEISRTQSTILLNKVKDVMKLVTVEANFNELYNETRTRPVTLYLPLPSTFKFDKKAILEVTGKALVGYDLEAVEIRIDSANRVLLLSNLPDPKILSIDHQIVFRNLEESWFNSFTAEDYTSLSANAKKVLEQKVMDSQLLDQAQEQGNRMIDALRFMAESAGWTVELEPAITEQLKTQIDSMLQ
jgi:hypothetical protein